MTGAIRTMGLVLLGCTASLLASADWQVVADESVLALTSTKNKTIAETHTISGLSGSVSEMGNVNVTVDLATLESNIPIRNERLQAMLFADHSRATFSAGVRVSALRKLEPGQKQAVQLAGDLTLNGIKAPLTIPVVVTRLDEQQFQVSGGGRLRADNFGFSSGLEELRKIAALQSIAPTVEYTLLITLRR